MSQTFAVILAAGKGTRMKSRQVKVLHPVCGIPMVEHVLRAVEPLQCDETVVVTGHGSQAVQDALGPRYSYVLQKEQLGTGHAVMAARARLENKKGQTIVLFGDTPLISSETLQSLLHEHRLSQAAVSILGAHMEDPHGYGRILRDERGQVQRIVEEKDASADEKEIKEVNTGFFCFETEHLLMALDRIDNHNKQQEYYLPDCIQVLKQLGYPVVAHMTHKVEETMGVNDRVALAHADELMRKRINTHWMEQGVSMVDPHQTYIDPDVTIGMDTHIYPGTIISGQSRIGEGCVIGPQTTIENSIVGDGCRVRQSKMVDSHVAADVNIGPFAHVRAGNTIGEHCHIGSFVELKNSVIKDRSKIPHLSYIGDTDIGNDVNVGCGSITVNYDGTNKHRTTIEDKAFIGCNTNLIAPITIGEASYVAAGSTITHSVPEESLAIARQRQTNKEQYMHTLKQKQNGVKGEG